MGSGARTRKGCTCCNAQTCSTLGTLPPSAMGRVRRLRMGLTDSFNLSGEQPKLGSGKCCTESSLSLAFGRQGCANSRREPPPPYSLVSRGTPLTSETSFSCPLYLTWSRNSNSGLPHPWRGLVGEPHSILPAKAALILVT